MSYIKEFAKNIPDYLITFDDFNVIKTIGRGGFGEVYMAEHKATGIICALKKLTISEEEFVGQHEKYFIREVDILSKTQNPFLLRLLGFSDHYPYCIATEFITNGSLYDAVHHKQGSPNLTGTQLTVIALVVAAGIQSLHEKNIIHRDIKTLNILLDDNLLPHVCDFGISREMNEANNNQAGPVTGDIGTPNWMAPELFSSTSYDNKVDVYAYGIMLWEMLTGRIPFEGKQPFAIMQDITKGIRPAIPENTPDALRELIRICWAPDPNDRPTFEMIVRALKNHRAAFAGTDNGKVDEIYKALSNHNLVPINNVKGSGSAPQEFSRILSNPRDPNYEPACINAIDSMKPEKFLLFLQIINQNTTNTAPQTLIKIIEALTSLLVKNQPCAEIFINNSAFTTLPYNIQPCIPVCNQLIEALFEGNVNILTQQIITFVVGLCTTQPITSLKALANYVSNLTAPLIETVVGYLITYAEYYKNCDSSEILIDTLFFYASKNPNYQYIPNIHQVFQLFLTSTNVAAVETSYRALIEMHVSDVNIATDTFINHLRFPQLALYVLLYLSTLPSTLNVTPSLVSAIIEFAKTDQLAIYILCLFAEKDETGKGLIQAADKWLISQQISIADSTRIFLACMCNVNLRPLIIRLPQLGTFFRAIAESGDKDLIDSLAPVIRRLDPFINNDFFVAIAKAQFLGILLRKGHSMNSTEIVQYGLVIIEQLARKCYLPDYLEYVPFATSFIKTTNVIEQKQINVSFLYSLSRYPESKPYLQKQNLKDALNPNYLSPELMQYANATFTNVGI